MRVRFTIGWILCVLTLLRADVLTCSCVWGGAFLTVGPKAELIVRGKVLRYSANSMEVEVSEALKGDPKGANVRIWGDTGILCRPYVTAFPVGTEWVFAVHSNPEKAEGGYVISACGEYAVRVQKDSVTGKLTPTKTDTGRSETMSLKELRTRLRTPVK